MLVNMQYVRNLGKYHVTSHLQAVLTPLLSQIGPRQLHPMGYIPFDTLPDLILYTANIGEWFGASGNKSSSRVPFQKCFCTLKRTFHLPAPVEIRTLSL